MSTWPDPSATVPTTDLDNDTDNLAAARVDLLDAVQKLNQILGTCDQASTPWTDLNDTTLQKRITSGTTNGIVLEDASGDVITSGKTISTSVGSTDTTVPTGKAVQTYVAASGGLTQSSTVSRALDTGGLSTTAHGLGQVPDLITSWLQCTTGDGNYAAGDRIYFGGTYPTLGAETPSGLITVYADSSFIYIALDETGIIDRFAACDASGSSSVLLDSDDWTIYAIAYKL